MADIKKVIILIVEGETEKSALSLVIKHIFNDNNIKFIVIGGDITSDYDSNEENILNRVIDKIQIDMNR